MKRMNWFLMAGVLGLFLASCSENNDVRPIDTIGQRYDGSFQSTSGKSGDLNGSIMVLHQTDVNVEDNQFMVDLVLNIEGQMDTIKNVVVHTGGESSAAISLSLKDLFEDNDNHSLNLVINIGLSLLLGLTTDNDQDLSVITAFSGSVQGKALDLDIMTNQGTTISFNGSEN